MLRNLTTATNSIARNSILNGTKATPIAIGSILTSKRNIFTIVPQYMGGIRLNFGKFSTEMQPGIRLSIPIFHEIQLLDTRSRVETVPNMRLISLDNVTFDIDVSIEYKISDSKKALLNVANVHYAVLERCRMELSDKLSSMTINSVLQNKSEISKSVLLAMSEIMEDWGIKVKTIQIKDIKFDSSMKQAMSTVAEATRQAEAKVINAKADIETAKQYSEAAKIYAENPMTVRLREFQLWNSVSKNPGSTIFVVPSNLLESVGKIANNLSSH